MDEIVTAALVGTARMGQQVITTTSGVDDLIERLGEANRERTLLLQAGAFAIYREAGQLPTTATAPLPPPAPAETLPQCTPRAAVLLELLITHHQALLPEACDRMIALGLRLPPDLLPLLFTTKLAQELRPAWRQIIGERGRWMAQHNKSWSWATESPVAGNTLPAAAETIWQEGGANQRIEILQRLRAVDTEQARAWIMQVWKQEKANLRTQMLETLAIGLTAADEPLLEQALDDRVESVRDSAITLLQRLPTSAYAQRMQHRAADMFKYDNGQLTIAVKRGIEQDPSWVRDGLPPEQPRAAKNKTSRTDWAVINVLERLPLNQWSEHFHATAADLVGAAQQTDHAGSFLLGWTRAAQLGNCDDWIAPLWQWWQTPVAYEAHEYWARALLLSQLPRTAAEDYARQTMPAPGENSNDNWSSIIGNLPGPWSAAFGHEFLTGVCAYIAGMESLQETDLDMEWTEHLDHVALCLPPECFGAALTAVVLPQGDHWKAHQWRNFWAEFTATIALRQRILEEIA